MALLSPAYLLSLLMPLAMAFKVNIVLHYLLCFAGMHLLLTRIVGIRSFFVVLFLNTAYTLSGGIALHLAVGHTTFLPFLYIPWVFYFFLLSMERGRAVPAGAAGCVIGIMLLNGGFNPVALLLVTMLVLTGLFTLLRGNMTAIKALAIAGVFAFLFSAPKLIPAYMFTQSDFTVDARTGTDISDHVPDEVIVQSLLKRKQRVEDKVHPRQRAGWHEYGNYAGRLLPVMFLAGLVFGLVRFRKYRTGYMLPFLITGLFLLLMTKGAAPYFPYTYLKQLPLFDQFRMPGRYILMVVFCMVLAVGFAWRHLRSFPGRSRKVRAGIAVLMLAGMVDIVDANRRYLGRAFPYQPAIREAPAGEPIRFDTESSPWVGGSPMYTSMVNNRSMVQCYEPIQSLMAWEKNRDLVYAIGPRPEFKEFRFSQNAISVKLVNSRPVRLAVNQNFNHGWKVAIGDTIQSPARGLAIDIPEGESTVRFEFFPPYLGAGVSLFMVGILLLGLLLWKERRESAAASK